MRAAELDLAMSSSRLQCQRKGRGIYDGLLLPTSELWCLPAVLPLDLQAAAAGDSTSRSKASSRSSYFCHSGAMRRAC